MPTLISFRVDLITGGGSNWNAYRRSPSHPQTSPPISFALLCLPHPIALAFAPRLIVAYSYIYIYIYTCVHVHAMVIRAQIFILIRRRGKTNILLIKVYEGTTRFQRTCKFLTWTENWGKRETKVRNIFPRFIRGWW